jgi:hypothetical protein
MESISFQKRAPKFTKIGINWDLMELDYAAAVIGVTQKYFPCITVINFCHVFKLEITQVADHLETCDRRVIRNFLILLYWCRHYPPFRTLGALFGLSKSQVRDIVHKLVDLYASNYDKFINLHNLERFEEFFLADIVGMLQPDSLLPSSLLQGIVDCTELVINKWVKSAYSGKAHDYTVKYQVVVGGSDFRAVHIVGPFLGSVSDAKIWNESDIAAWMLENEVKVLGDKGYVGCSGVEAMKKKKKGQAKLDPKDKEYNNKIAKIRVKVENHFADQKKWKVLSHDFRGDLHEHYKLFICVEFLTRLQKETC